MLPDHPHYALGVTGISGSGKSTFVCRFLQSPRSKATARFVFDPVGSLIRRLGLTAAIDGPGLMRQLQSGWCCFYPFGRFNDLAEAAEWFCGFVMTASQNMGGRKFAVFDELQDYGDGHKPPPQLVAVFNKGRNYGIDPVYITQSFGEVSRSLVKQTTEACAFHTSDTSNEWWLRRWGFNLEAVIRQPKGAFIVRNLDLSTEASGAVF